ncbi:Gryzun, putative trafficking through Golgi [Teratosphaeria destructans]|uniref:Gryzun, putative trafficking through Golgi n=1 Tax=Teratosphaeria destructans TaxID=418781 RepID=A0A9W7T013_9PEZI|nr:Gryzun, putative trafficking through Golgi [Teratosphaeria destructans]
MADHFFGQKRPSEDYSQCFRVDSVLYERDAVGEALAVEIGVLDKGISFELGKAQRSVAYEQRAYFVEDVDDFAGGFAPIGILVGYGHYVGCSEPAFDMEAFPPQYVEHQLPLIVLSGLGERSDGSRSEPLLPRQESGTKISTSSAECDGDRAVQLLDILLKHDGRAQAWNATALPGPTTQLKYRMKAIGRTYMLPPRKAAPLPQSPSIEAFANPQANQHHRSTELHSPMSPLSPGSPIYPDGVFTPLWFAKHQQQVPALFLAFFKIAAGDDTSTNEQIQIDINAIRTALSRSGFKTRFAAVLMSDTSILHSPELEERLSAIRRATSLDPKSGLFFMPPMSSQAEMSTFVHSMFATLQPLVVEHYRDLTKHARRKKGRGGPAASVAPSIEGSPRSLSTPGWNVRYEIKQGVFAEFRQEMDVAERHYTAAVDELFGSEGVFEATASWSPRWDEARLLCDSIALRVVRCQLWSGMTTGAVVSWVNYQARMKDLIDRRGKGSQTYGWDAWESRWSEIMAQLIQRAALPDLQSSAKNDVDASTEAATTRLFAQSEKNLDTVERLPPFHLLHHPGYWYRMSFRSEKTRRGKALTIPEEDRSPPGQSPASAVVKRTKQYDTYLVPQAHEEFAHDHMSRLSELAIAANQQFYARDQIRSGERLTYDLAVEMVSARKYEQAQELLLPLWETCTWRDNDWAQLFGPLLALLHVCALQTGNAATVAVTAWELLRIAPPDHPVQRGEIAQYVSHKCADTSVAVKLENRQRLAPITMSFTFTEKETYVGEAVECQVTLTSLMSSETSFLPLSRVELAISNGRKLVIRNCDVDDKDDQSTTFVDLSAAQEDGDGNLAATADLRLRSGRIRVYSLFLTFKDAGIVRLRQASVFVESEIFGLEHTFTDEDLVRWRAVYKLHGGQLMQTPLHHLDTTSVTVLPKPPKLQIVLHGLKKEYYTNEEIHFEAELINEEIEAVKAHATIAIAAKQEDIATVWWTKASTDLPSELTIDSLLASGCQKASFAVQTSSTPSSFTVEIEVDYALEPEPDTCLTKSLSLEISTIVPFTTSFTFGPLLHIEHWPSYFKAKPSPSIGNAEGIPQRWRLGCTVSSAALNALVIRGMSIVADNVGGDAACEFDETDDQDTQSLPPAASTRRDFQFITRKLSLDDRRPTTADLSLQLAWSREADGNQFITRATVPHLSLPTSEPRVLCTVLEQTSSAADLVLQYHLENLSMHFLTFALTMEASDDYAFSGPKHRALSLAPLSRLRVEYELVLHDSVYTSSEEEGSWIWPQLQVIDSYYRKHLRVQAAGPRVVVDEKRGIGVLVEEIQKAPCMHVILKLKPCLSRMLPKAPKNGNRGIREIGRLQNEDHSQTWRPTSSQSSQFMEQLARDKVVESLLNADKRLATRKDDDDRLPLHWAASYNRLPIVELLTEQRNCEIDAQDGSGWTALMMASSLKDADALVDFLLAKGADTGVKTNNGQTALHFAASKSNLDTARKLIAHKASARVKDKRGQLPLHRAACVGNVPIIKLMLENNSPINATDIDGSSALHHAIAEGHGDAALVLLKAGADTDKQDARGCMAIDLAPDAKVRSYIIQAAEAEGIDLAVQKAS